MNIASIEAGGTKFIVGIVSEDGKVVDKMKIDTTSPEVTMNLVIEYFNDKTFSCIGLGCFGPIETNKLSEKYGWITSTPKLAWQNYDILGKLKKHFNCPIGFNTDVNGAALGELLFGAAKGLSSCLYITVGTGIGAGAVVNSQMVNGLIHPEMGHMIVRRHEDDDFEGSCIFHKDCLEGLASGTAINKRWNSNAEKLSDNKQVWEFESYYLAQAISNLILILSPEKIILGGGVMNQSFLFELIREKVKLNLNDYINKKEIVDSDYILFPKLGNNAGLIGSAMIGLKEYKNEN